MRQNYKIAAAKGAIYYVTLNNADLFTREKNLLSLHVKM